MQKSLIEKAADFISENNYNTINKTALNVAKWAVLDYLGCAVAGQQEEVVKKLISISHKNNCQGNVTAFGGGTYQLKEAAMINAVAGHALDFDDTSWTTIGHPTTVAAPVALGEAQRLGLSGKYVLAAYAIGVEVAHTFARMTMPEVSEQGWHTTSVYGAIMAAATSAWMRNLPPEIVVNALGIALSRAGGIRSNFGSMTKPLHAGLAVKAGIECVDMSEAGITASKNAFEGADGFVSCFSQLESPHHANFGEPWDLAKNGLAFKLYPCCSGSHPTLDLLSDLIKKGISAQEIQSIHLGVSLLGPRELVNHCPKTPLEARFSLEYAVATMLLRKRFTLDELTPESVMAPDVQAYMQRITMAVDDDLAKLGFIGTAPVKLHITMKNGDVLIKTNDLARGNPEKPLTDLDFSNKFLSNTARFLSQEKSQTLLEMLSTLEKQQSISELMRLACSNE